MKLSEFLQNFTLPNTLVRLWYPAKGGGYEMVSKGENVVSMNHQILSGNSAFPTLINHEVIGVASIIVRGHYSVAVNIVIKRDLELETDEFVKQIHTSASERIRDKSSVSNKKTCPSCGAQEIDTVDGITTYECGTSAFY